MNKYIYYPRINFPEEDCLGFFDDKDMAVREAKKYKSRNNMAQQYGISVYKAKINKVCSRYVDELIEEIK